MHNIACSVSCSVQVTSPGGFGRNLARGSSFAGSIKNCKRQTRNQFHIRFDSKHHFYWSYTVTATKTSGGSMV